MEFLTKEEVVPARGEIMDVTIANLARLYVGEPIAETIGLSGVSGLWIFIELRGLA